LLRWSTGSRTIPWWGAYVAPAVVLVLTIALLSLGYAYGWGTALAGFFLASPAKTVPTPMVATVPGLPEVEALELERSRLLLEIAQLKEELTVLQQTQAGVTHIIESPESYTLQTARILYRDPEQVIPAFILDQGTQDGLQVGQPVMGQMSVIGRISAVWPNRARVDLLTRPGVRFGAVVQSSRALGVVEGSGGQLQLDFVAKGSTLTSNDAIVTSGVPGYTPPGLPIGIVGTVSDESEALTLRVQVMPLENPWTLAIVQVVRVTGAPLADGALESEGGAGTDSGEEGD